MIRRGWVLKGARSVCNFGCCSRGKKVKTESSGGLANEKLSQSKLSADQSQSPVVFHFRLLWENYCIVSSLNSRKLCFYSSGDLKDLDQGGSLVGPDERALVGV